MWKRFTNLIVCPTCAGSLELVVLEGSDPEIKPEYIRAARERGIPVEDLGSSVEEGLLLCVNCRTKYPIVNGLPILLTYQTRSHSAFLTRHENKILRIGDGYRFANAIPVVGEEAVRESFSEEWHSYDYDGVIWEMSYQDHEARLLSEVGTSRARSPLRNFLEVGCGVGLTTLHAQRNFGLDAVGLDLSSAPGKATVKFRDNPFLHFVQASVFAPPFRRQTFDLVYSRGVLHHTFSTEKAFQCIAPLCRSGGTVYVWVYGPGSIQRSFLRRGLYVAERTLRPVLSRDPSSVFARSILAMLAIPYWVYNAMRRLQNPRIQRLNFKRAVHAARDRFTPKFAHRHSSDEVRSWFHQLGFEHVEVVDWRSVPEADHADFGRNTAVRGVAGAA